MDTQTFSRSYTPFTPSWAVFLLTLWDTSSLCGIPPHYVVYLFTLRYTSSLCGIPPHFMIYILTMCYTSSLYDIHPHYVLYFFLEVYHYFWRYTTITGGIPLYPGPPKRTFSLQGLAVVLMNKQSPLLELIRLHYVTSTGRWRKNSLQEAYVHFRVYSYKHDFL